MDNNISFSFIMPAYKGQFLYKAIYSIIHQNYTNFELVIINDRSPEKLEDIIESFHDIRIKYYTNSTNLGKKDLVANWNNCISKAKNDYIILATDDDLFEPTFLSDAVELLGKYPSIDIIRSGVKKIDETEHILDIEFPLKEHMTQREFTLFYAKGGTISCVSNYIYKKEALISNGGFISFPKAHFSDDATALTLSKNGIVCIPHNNFLFRVSNINLSNQQNLSLVIAQLQATELYTEWFCKHIVSLDTKENDFFEIACYGGIKVKYINMIERLTDKIPLSKMHIAIKAIYTSKHLFKKEKLKLYFTYFINKLCSL